MFCLKCGYNLFGLPNHICPECGSGFNPSDDSTYSHTAHRRRSVPFRLVCLMTLYPLIPLALVWATWLAARLHLGRIPKAMADDPKQLGGLVPVAYVAAYLSLGGLLLGAPIYAAALLIYGVWGRENDRSIRVALLVIVAAIETVLVVSLLQSHIGQWLLD